MAIRTRGYRRRFAGNVGTLLASPRPDAGAQIMRAILARYGGGVTGHDIGLLMLEDVLVRTAIMSLTPRSERQPDQEHLIRSFVDAGIRALLDNENNQIIYGRRGTGKTHLLKVLDPSYDKSVAVVFVYIDARVLGSTNQFSDPTLPLKQRCLSLFRDIFTHYVLES